MPYTVNISDKAQKKLRKLPPTDGARILEKIQGLESDPRPAGATNVIGMHSAYRLRQGDYRVLYTISDETITVEVIDIGHRKDIYR